MKKTFLIFALMSTLSLNAFGNNFSVGIGTEYPLGINADFIYNPTDFQFYGHARLGKFLASYTDSMNSIAEDFDFYNSATSEIISESLHDATYYEMALGWTPDVTKGFFAEFSYLSVSGSGQVTGATIAEAVSGVSLPAGTNYYDIEGDVQSLGLRLGYKWTVTESSCLWFSAAIFKPISSDTKIDRDVSGPIQQAILDAANRELNEYMQDTFKNDVYIPTLALNWIYQI